MILFLILLSFAVAYPTVANRNHVERHWKKLGDRAVEERLQEPIRIALKHDADSLREFVSLADKIADPYDAMYGKYLNTEQIAKLLDASRSETIVRRWIEAELMDEKVVVERVLTGDWLVVRNVVVQKLERALNVRMSSFEHRQSGRRLFRTLDRPSIDDKEVATAIELMLGVGEFFDFKSERRRAATKQSAAAASNGPEIMAVRGSETKLVLEARMYDVNGKPLGSLQPRWILNLNVTSSTGTIQEYLEVSSDNCYVDQSTANRVICTLRMPMVPYSRVSVSAQTIFIGSSPTVLSTISTLMYNATMAPWIDPAVAFDIYRVPQGMFATSGRVSQSVVAFEEQYILMEDLQQFHELNGLPFDESLFDIIGPNNQSMPGGESTLDISWIAAIGRNVPTQFLSFCGPGPAKGPCGAYVLDWAIYVNNHTSPALVTSISYGDTEQAYVKKFGSFVYIDRMETELAKMATRGLTVIAGSGDAGATNVGEEGNDIGPTDPSCGIIRPFYPSDSKYVVSASATLLSTHTTAFCNSANSFNNIRCSRVSEASVSMTYGGTPWTTGGAFSGHIAQPSWQVAAVKQYLASIDSSQLPAKFNAHGRAYADLSAIGFNLMMVLGGEIVPVGGTSASGPVLGGFFSLLNDVQFNRGKTSLGNPLPWIWTVLSKTPGAFNDLVYGRNDDGDLQPRGSSFPSLCPLQPFNASGFPLAPRYDVPSGWGSPVYDVWVNNLP